MYKILKLIIWKMKNIKTIFTLFITVLLMFSCSTSQENITLENSENTIKKEDKKILALWDSLTAWYNLSIEDSYPYKLNNILKDNWYSYNVINAWVSWNTSKNLISRINLYKDNYEIVLLNIWWNDALRSLSIDDLKSNILDIIKKFPNSSIILFWIDLPSNYWLVYRNNLKNMYKEISNEKSIYFYGSFFDWLDHSKHFLNDQIHPNEEWYEIVSSKVFKFLVDNKIIKND